MKGVFDTKPDSGYDDEITTRYHFPSQYQEVAEKLIDDWIVYREPRRNKGRQSYIAVARVTQIERDAKRSKHLYASVANYTAFEPPVPFFLNGNYVEEPLRALGNPKRVGAYLQGKSVRPLSEVDFDAIVRAGLKDMLALNDVLEPRPDPSQLDDEERPFIHELPDHPIRRIEQILLNRKIRDANFRRQVCSAYDQRCAVTGLRIINGGGKAEVQAAHIWPVAEGGPDVVQNGLALCGTAHWLFDRHLISVTDNYRLLVSHNKVPGELRNLFEKQLERIHLPHDKRYWPHPGYLARHRNHFH